MLKTPRPRGCSWSIVRQQGPITLLGWSPHWLLNSFATHMTWGCGGVCAQSSRFPLSRRADVRGAASMPGFEVSTSSERACLLVQLDGLFAHHPQAPPSGGPPVGG